MTLHRFFRILRLRWRSLTQPQAMEAELDREIALHYEELVREQVTDGVPLAEARRAARRTLGNVAGIKQASRDHRRVIWLHDVWRDVQYGARRIRHRPMFGAIAVTSLAIGIGLNAAVFSAIDTTLWSPLPLPHAERLVVLHTRNWETGNYNNLASHGEYRAWSRQNRTFDTLAASFGGDRDFGADDHGVPAERVQTAAVTSEWFATLGVAPAIGRTFTTAEYGWGDVSQVMLISYPLWQERYGRDPAILTRRVRVNGIATAIAGVMPPDFQYQDRRIQAWFPLRMNPAPGPGPLPGQGRLFRVIGRLNRNVSVEQARDDLERISLPLASTLPKHFDWRPEVVLMGDANRQWATRPLAALATVVALGLLIVCANLSGVLLAETTSRRQEIAMRLALGANRSRIVRQLVVEGMVVAAIAGVFAVSVAWIGLTSLTWVMSPPIGSPRFVVAGVTIRVIGGIALLSILSGLVIHLLPALATLRLEAAGSLMPSGRPPPTRSSHIVRNALVALQIAASVVLLVGAGLVLQSFIRLAYRDLKFDPQQLVRFQFRTPKPAPAETLARIHGVLSTVPGVDAVAGISDWPLNSILLPRIDVRATWTTGPAGEFVEARHFLVTPGYFATMRTPLVSGREFDGRDEARAPWGVVVNETAARRLWPGQNPLGQHITFQARPEEPPRIVIGVVSDMPLNRRALAAPPVVYASYLQQTPAQPGPIGSGIFGRMTFVVRYRDDPDVIALAAQRLVAAIDSDRPLVYEGEVGALGVPMFELRNYGAGLTLVGGAATLLALMGLYGVIAHTVARGTKEIGIRLALGAPRREAIRIARRPALGIVLFGIGGGIACSLVLSRLFSDRLWGVSATDPATLATVVVGTLMVAWLASMVPARRAADIDPAETLRAE